MVLDVSGVLALCVSGVLVHVSGVCGAVVAVELEPLGRSTRIALGMRVRLALARCWRRREDLAGLGELGELECRSRVAREGVRGGVRWLVGGVAGAEGVLRLKRREGDWMGEITPAGLSAACVLLATLAPIGAAAACISAISCSKLGRLELG